MRVIVVHVPVASVDHVGLGGAGGFQDADRVRVRHHSGFVYAIGTQLLILQEELHEYLTLCNATALQPVTLKSTFSNAKSLWKVSGGGQQAIGAPPVLMALAREIFSLDPLHRYEHQEPKAWCHGEGFAT